MVCALVSDHDIVFLQQCLNILYELTASLLRLDIVTLSVSEAKEMFECR